MEIILLLIVGVVLLGVVANIIIIVGAVWNIVRFVFRLLTLPIRIVFR